MMTKEKLEARKLILVEDKCGSIGYHSEETMTRLLQTEVDKVYRFAIGPRSFSLVKLTDIGHFRDNVSPSQADPLFPIHGRILKLTKFPKNIVKVAPTTKLQNLSLEKLTSNRRIDILRKNPDHETAINELVASSQMTEFGSKLRFFFLTHLEENLCSGIFSNFHLRPFGSSVNGFGDDQSDFDLVMSGKPNEPDPLIASLPHLCYLSKPSATERFQSQRLVDFVGDQLQFFTPAVMSVTRVPRARVPIVKLYSDSCGLDCDISFFSETCVHMAETLFLFSKMDPRVKQLAVFVKLWAKSQDLTNSSPGPWVTNFMLMLMVINFFQTRHGNGAIFNLPPVTNLEKLSKVNKKEDTGEDKSFLSILREFLEFVEEFDYSRYGMSILNGRVVVKSHHDFLYIENPLEPDLNVCKNVSKTEVLRVIASARSSLTIMDGSRNFNLGDICLPSTKNTSSAFVNFNNKNRGSKGIKVNDFWEEEAR
jgi:poly(A) RNA polymerase